MPNPLPTRTAPVLTFSLAFAAAAALPVGAWDKDKGPASPQFQGNPSVISHWPRGGQRGTTVEVAFTGTRLDDPRGLVCLTTDKITCTKVDLPPPPDKTPDRPDRPRQRPRPGNPPPSTALATLAIAPDCPPGQHVLRLLTANGIADVATFWVGGLPEIMEQEHANNSRTHLNGTRDTAEILTGDGTVSGMLNGMETDTYRFEAKQGQRFSAELEATRLRSTPREDGFQAGLEITDATGKILASASDHPLFLTDPFLSLTVPADGPLFVSVRPVLPPDNTSRPIPYRLHLGSFLRPDGVYPAGGNPGTALTVELQGLPDGEKAATAIQLPGAGAEGADFSWQASPGTPSPNLLRLLAGPNVLETEPNNTPEQATPVPAGPLPFACNGKLASAGDTDHFRFTAAKGDVIQFRTFAQALGTPLDLKLAVAPAASPDKSERADDANDEQLGLFDAGTDRRKLDPVLVFTAPADGDYLLTVSESQGATAPQNIYRIEATAPDAGFITTLQPLDRNTRLLRNAVSLSRGNRVNATFSARSLPGTKADGEYVLTASGLPAGVTFHSEPFTLPAARIPVLFEAAPNAVPAITPVTLGIQSKDGSPPFPDTLRHTIPLAQLGNDATQFVTVHRLAVGVIDPAPFKLTVASAHGPLMKNGEIELAVTLERAQGYNEVVEILLETPPRGITGAQGITLSGDQTTIGFRLAADNNATPGHYPVILTTRNKTGDNRTGAGKIYTASNLVPVEIADPYLKIKFARSRIERGGESTVTATLERLRDLPGKATASLIRLPRGVTHTGGPVEIGPDNTLTFTVSSTLDALVGTYQGMACEIAVESNGGQLRQVAGSGPIRVDPSRQANP